MKFHIHWHHPEPWELYDWGGLIAQRMRWACRCGHVKKSVIRGALKR